MLVAFKDITEQKIAEEKVLALVAELETRNDNKNEFISMLAHELRNPLATINAAAELLESYSLRRKRQADNRDVKTPGRTSVSVGRRSADVTRITRTALSLNKEIIKINAIVTDIISDIRPRFAEKGLELLENISPEPIFVNADVLRITQCIANILANALKYTPEGGTVRIELKAEDESAVITVRDRLGDSSTTAWRNFRTVPAGAKCLK